MAPKRLHAVTGAFGHTGKHIAQRLMERGHEVVTLTNSPERPNPFGGKVRTFPLRFDEPEKLREALRGVSVLHNTYWVRFNHRTFTFAEAVENTFGLIRAAQEAGVERVVHVSITNPAQDSPLEYFRGKAVIEQELRESGLSHTILRPAVLFGGDDILINNIAGALRRFPVFGVLGDGGYRLQPIHVDDLAVLAAEQAERPENSVINAIGPETFTCRELAETLAEAIGKRRRIVSVRPGLGHAVCWVTGKMVGDVIVTRDEIRGLMANLLFVDSPPTGTTRLTEWARTNAQTLGRRYASELRRRRHRESTYSDL